MGVLQVTDVQDIVVIMKLLDAHSELLRYINHHIGNRLGAAYNALEVLIADEYYKDDKRIKFVYDCCNHVISDLKAAGFLVG